MNIKVIYRKSESERERERAMNDNFKSKLRFELKYLKSI